MPSWVNEGFQTYHKRLPPEITLSLVEIPMEKRGKAVNLKNVQQKEIKAIRQNIGKNHLLISLDPKGKRLSTEKLATFIDQWKLEGTNATLLIGGPEGLPDELLNLSDLRWSLSDMTFPHPLVRVILAEQIYRATTILSGHPYHK